MAEKKQKTRQIKINPRIYPLRVIYSSSYLFLDKAYIFLDGDPEKEVLVSITPKDGFDLQQIAGEFKNELLNASLRYQISKENRKIREFIVGSALVSATEKRDFYPQNECGCVPKPARRDDQTVLKNKRNKAGKKETSQPDEDRTDDPLGIGVSWEEKYEKSSPGKV